MDEGTPEFSGCCRDPPLPAASGAALSSPQPAGLFRVGGKPQHSSRDRTGLRTETPSLHSPSSPQPNRGAGLSTPRSSLWGEDGAVSPPSLVQ